MKTEVNLDSTDTLGWATPVVANWVLGFRVASVMPDPLPGDTDRDGDVDLNDFVTFKKNFGAGTTWAEGDWNSDGVFDQKDISTALATGNYFQGPYEATSGDLDRDDPGTDKSIVVISDGINNQFTPADSPIRESTPPGGDNPRRSHSGALTSSL